MKNKKRILAGLLAAVLTVPLLAGACVVSPCPQPARTTDAVITAASARDAKRFLLTIPTPI